ncbi:MAG: hypothetical protein JWM53_1077 [bacterium]|nr:hypothetical protein [bacterium]
MLKSAALLVMLVATPALAQEGARTDVATVRKLIAQAATLIARRAPADLALAVAQVNLGDEVRSALVARPAAGLKVAPR